MVVPFGENIINKLNIHEILILGNGYAQKFSNNTRFVFIVQFLENE